MSVSQIWVLKSIGSGLISLFEIKLFLILGTHLNLICRENTRFYYAIMTTTCTLPTHWLFLLKTVQQFMQDSWSTIKVCKNSTQELHLQWRNLELCCIFCIYIAKVIYTKDFNLYLYMNDIDLWRFATHNLWLKIFYWLYVR